MITRQRVTDPTSGFRMTDRRGIELFARDYPHDYPEVEAVLHGARPPPARARDAGADARARAPARSSIGSTQSVYYMIKVLLAVFVGLLRARPAVDAGRRRRPSSRSTRSDMDSRACIQIVAIVVTGGLFFLVFELVRRRRLHGALRAAVAVRDRGAARAWPSGGACSSVVASTVGIFYAPSALFAVAFGFVLVLLLHFSLVDLAPGRPEQGARAAARACCSSAIDRRSRAEADAAAERDAEPSSAPRGI